ncbi:MULTISPECIES: hypothetical protein [Mycetohabitans]|uniref:hypothetical protein n=1 Tax=Mycetohabitans TaxID=2571159 RepID=UPI001F45099B|nr:hypothetical protein [Mycetohabitans sp. B3]MCF2135412.1 hypothetical protein [Mycetohabitans sp. B3]
MLTMSNGLIQPSEAAMCRISAVILIFLFSLVSVPAWSDIGRYTTATPAPQDGVMRVQGIQITDIVAEDTACPENGRIARDANGTPLFCQSGRWSYATASGGKYICIGREECGFSSAKRIEGDITMLYLSKRNESKKTQWFMIHSIPKEYDHGVCRAGGIVAKEKPEWLGNDFINPIPSSPPNKYAFVENGDRDCSVVIPVPPGSVGTLRVNNVSARQDGSKIKGDSWFYKVSIYE